MKFKAFCSNTDILLAGLIIVVGLSSFTLGRLSVSQTVTGSGIDRTAGGAPQVQSATALNAEESTDAQITATAHGGYVASKNGTKYHLPWCGSAKQIKEENKIWFATKEEAEAAGYTPAANCKGI